MRPWRTAGVIQNNPCDASMTGKDRKKSKDGRVDRMRKGQMKKKESYGIQNHASFFLVDCGNRTWDPSSIFLSFSTCSTVCFLHYSVIFDIFSFIIISYLSNFYNLFSLDKVKKDFLFLLRITVFIRLIFWKYHSI